MFDDNAYDYFQFLGQCEKLSYVDFENVVDVYIFLSEFIREKPTNKPAFSGFFFL